MVNPKRVKLLTDHPWSQGQVIYWMSRDQRVEDNWALLFAQELAQKQNTHVAVVFCLRKKFDFATERLVEFMLAGLAEVEERLHSKHIPFYFLLGDPTEAIADFIAKGKVGAVVTDFSPLKYNRDWKERIAKKITIPLYEVDTHNIIPVWEASQKQEFGAYTLRLKIHRLLPEFLEAFPSLASQKDIAMPQSTNWKRLRSLIEIDHSVPKVTWLTPGQKAAHTALEKFATEGIVHYQDRNDPTKHAQSELSSYIHFGHIASQRIALRLQEERGHIAAKDAFLEELIVRKELSDNFCLYNSDYDNLKGFPAWAQKTLAEHADDKREFVYTLAELEQAKTHDQLWNAAQKEMLHKGKMHGYMRMYWAKKILEWSSSIVTAHKHAIYLNDKYFLDGRDPNGYTGIAWSLGGVHDRAWFERAIFGKIRYMSYNGAKSKFDIDAYINSVEK